MGSPALMRIVDRQPPHSAHRRCVPSRPDKTQSLRVVSSQAIRPMDLEKRPHTDRRMQEDVHRNSSYKTKLAAREISLRSWLCLLCSERKLPRVHCRDDVLWTLLMDLYLVYLVIRAVLRVTKGGELLQIADVKFSGRSRRSTEVFNLSEWQRLAMTRNPIVECGRWVREPHPSARSRKIQMMAQRADKHSAGVSYQV